MSAEKRINIREERVKFAFREVESWGGSWRKKALASIKDVPVAIRTNGIAVVLATLVKGEGPSERIAEIVARWLLTEAPRKTLISTEASSGSKDGPRLLMKTLIEADRSQYLAAQSEAIALTEQLKLFAEALHGRDERN